MKKIILSLITAFIGLNFIIGQEVQLSPSVIASAGGFAEADQISLSWTLGELAVTTLTNNGITLTQGFQQGYLPGTGFKVNPILWNVKAYPNPVRNDLFLEFNMPESEDFLIELQDVTGRLQMQKESKEVMSGDIITINMSAYNSGIYFLRLSTSDRSQVRVYNISKE